jgi:hypothetical protein
VRNEIEEHLGEKVGLTIRHIEDVRNYKVSFEKAKNVLSFHPRHDVRSIVGHLIKYKADISDWDNPAYYNIQRFRQIENGIHGPILARPAGAGK